MKLCISLALALCFLSGFSQTTTPPDLSQGYYVVVASYIKGEEAYAEAYSAKLNQEGKHSLIGFDQGRKFYHVYLSTYTDFNESVQEMLKTRTAGFPTAWVRIIKPSSGEAVASAPAKTESRPESKSESKAGNKIVTRTVATTVQPPAVTTAGTTPQAKANVPNTVTEPQQAQTPPPTVEEAASAPTTPPVAPETPRIPEVTNNDEFIHPPLLTGTAVLFAMFNPTNRDIVDGTVEIVDADRAKLLDKAKGNDSLLLPDPKSKSGKLTLIGSSFGYRPVQHDLNYSSTEKDSMPNFMDVVNGRYRISFGMDILRRGDITVLYNVYFYNDAAIMLPDSKYELNKLLKLMNDNPGFRIKLHGHTNGGGHGKIVSLPKGSQDFFTLSSDAKSGFGSAKELSRQRAQLIKEWLVANNISEKRIEVQAHGGSRMIHDKNSANAKRNVRVEVEML